MRRSARTGTLLLLLAVPACSRAATGAPAARSGPADAPSAPSVTEQLDELDPRAPVPLLPRMAHHQKQNMRDHLVAVQEIVAALATDDFAAVERAAGRIGFSEPMGQMCTHMGAGAPGFTERALAFHHTADDIGIAAREGDRVRVLSALGATLETCTSCHATWKQQLVDEPAFRRLTAELPPAHRAPH